MKSLLKKVFKRWETFLLVFLVLEFVVFGAANPKFLRPASIMSSIVNYISVCIISLFVTLVMITGGIDIQAPSIIGLTSIIIGVLWSDAGMNIWLAVLIATVVAALCGALSGFFIAYCGVQPMVVTLGGSFLYSGLALLISGAIAGMGGAFMSMAYVSGFTKDMVSGRGFIALAAEAMGRGRPLLSSLAELLFGFTDSLANNLQVLGLSSDLARMFPYVITIIALSIYAGRSARGRKAKRRR